MSVLHSIVAMRGLGRDINVFKATSLICSLTFQLFQTDETFKAALQIRADQRLITANPRPLTTPIYQIMTIVTGGFSKRFFFYYFYFLEILLNDLEIVFLEFKYIYKTQRISLFSFYPFIFYLLFSNYSVY